MEKIWKIRAAVAGTLAVLSIIIKLVVFTNRVANVVTDDVPVVSGEEDPGDGEDLDAVPPPVMPPAPPEAVAAAAPPAMPAPAAATPAPAPAPAPTPVAADGGGSATDELLAQAKTAAPVAPAADPGPASGPGNPAAPGSNPGQGGTANDQMQRMMQAQAAPNNAGGLSQEEARMQAQMQAAMQAQTQDQQAAGSNSGDDVAARMAADIGSSSIDPGSSGGSGKEPSFKTPLTGATAFLDALKAKDPQKLLEATALRSRFEASASHIKLFEQILDEKLPQETLEEFAEAFEGYKVTRLGGVVGTGHQPVILMKQSGKDNLQRILTLRKEKAGWKVSDFGGIRKFKSRPQFGRGRGMRRGR